jgi:uncharacterized protein YbbC (DUF1343 family)
MFKYGLFVILMMFYPAAYGQNGMPVPAAERPELYLPQLQDKRVALVVNQTSVAFGKHLIDYLILMNIKVTRIFAPEHGFRGQADAGQDQKDYTDKATGIPVISLYGAKNKPVPADLKNIDIVVYDIQDVGVRFYTYISTLHLVMESCAENHVKFMILDRPDPNGDYVDGPVMQDSLKSFVGMDPIPVVYGLTPGELAKMINGEHWLKDSVHCDLEVIPVGNYDHNTKYSLPVRPSPNLPDDTAVRLYPSICLFEGTIMSVGRGTLFPFQVSGYPDSIAGDFAFMPQTMEGATKPKYEGQNCFGKDYRNLSPVPRFTLSFLLDFYNKLGRKYDFFNSYFDKLAGTRELQKQIMAGFNEEEIRITWYDELKHYKELRKKYLLYPDFN